MISEIAATGAMSIETKPQESYSSVFTIQSLLKSAISSSMKDLAALDPFSKSSSSKKVKSQNYLLSLLRGNMLNRYEYDYLGQECLGWDEIIRSHL